jgi:hypothetical protein
MAHRAKLGPHAAALVPFLVLCAWGAAEADSAAVLEGSVCRPGVSDFVESASFFPESASFFAGPDSVPWGAADSSVLRDVGAP